MDLRKQARGRACQVRLVGICNHNSETVVLAHYRLPGLSGLGIKSPDWLASWACSACHAYVDGNPSDREAQLDFANGVFRTLAQLDREGAVKVA